MNLLSFTHNVDPICEWDGIMCDDEKFVTEIELIERKIKAKIPSDIGKLIHLEKVRSLLIH